MNPSTSPQIIGRIEKKLKLIVEYVVMMNPASSLMDVFNYFTALFEYNSACTETKIVNGIERGF